MLGKMVQRWRTGQANLSDKTRSGRPVTASDQLHQDRVEELIGGNRRIKKKIIIIIINK